MSASTVRFHRLPLVVALLLAVQAQMAVSDTFHLTASSLGLAMFGSMLYSAQYELTLVGTQLPFQPGVYAITGVSGTRTYNGVAQQIDAVNMDLLLTPSPLFIVCS